MYGVDWYKSNLDTLLLTQFLPRDDVGVVFHLGYNDDIVALQIVTSPTVGSQIDRFCSPTRVDHILGARSEVPRDTHTRSFQSGGGFVR